MARLLKASTPAPQMIVRRAWWTSRPVRFFLRFALYLVICGGAIVMIAPLVWMISTATKPLQDTQTPQFALLGSRFQLWENLVSAFQRVDMFRYFMNSVVVASGHVVGEIILASLAGYSFARYTYPGRDILFFIVLSTMMIPFFVVIIPLYIVMYQLGWLNSYQALIVPGMASGFGIFLMRQFIAQIPAELVDAARIDGASEIAIYARIIMPLCSPAVATLAILSFLASWDSYIWPLTVIGRTDMYTLPLGLIRFQSDFIAYWNEMMAAAIIGMLPTYVLFLAFQKYFVQGVVMSGLKG